MEKLSVQERLSLATKTRSKSKKKNKKLSSPGVLESSVEIVEGSVEPVKDPAIDNTNLVKDTPFEAKSTEQKKPDIVDGHVAEYFNNLLAGDSNVRDMDTQSILAQLYPVVQKFEQDAKTGAKQRHISSSDSSLIKLIKEKDEKIDALMKEGEALSKKELQLSEKTKKLSKTIKDLEGDFTAKLEELEDVKTQANVLENTNESLMSTVKELEAKYDSVSKKYDALKQDYEEHLSTAYESKILELNKMTEENKSLKEEIATLKEHEVSKQKSFDIKYKALEEASKEEVDRLENKLEQLRIDLENSNARTIDTNNGNSTNTDSYDKLVAQYKAVQHELKETNSNWTTIEYALNQKCDTLKLTKDAIEKENTSLTSELKQMKETNTDLLSKLDIATDENAKLKAELTKTAEKLKHLSQNLANMTDDYHNLQKQHEIQRSQLEKALSGQAVRRHVDEEQVTNVFEEAATPKLAYGLTGENPMKKWNNEHSSVDPLQTIPDEDQAVGIEDEFSFERDLDIPDEAADLELLKRGSSDMSLSFNTPNLRPSTGRESVANAASSNLQMVTRLGAEIRRLETELSSIREAYNRKVEEIERANEQISSLLENEDKLQVIESEKNELLEQLESLQTKQNTVLQLLGEKTERVEELENDVADLKDLMRTQVQQIVQLQEQL